jgi:integrase
MRRLNRLSVRAAEAQKTPGKYADGGNLYLIVEQGGSKRWAFIYKRAGKFTEIGLGGFGMTTLSAARRKAETYRQMLGDGLDPLVEKRKLLLSRQQKQLPTFKEFADALIRDLLPGFRNDAHKRQWQQTVAVYASPLHDIAINAITADHVLAVIKPMWASKNATAARLRGRIERILDAAKVKGLREGENPARWKGHLDQLLPKPNKLARGHHAALPYKDLPEFMAKLRTMHLMTAFALEFCILTAARTGEVLGATEAELHRAQALWIVPAVRIKAGREHRVPLCKRALELAELAAPYRTGEYLFSGARQGRPLSDTVMFRLLHSMGFGAYTVHGFRSTFRDWVAEETDFQREVAEAALAHIVGDETERAYRRGDALEKRRKLMDAWAAFCG